MSQPTATVNLAEEAPQKKKKGWRKIFEWLFTYDKEKWLKEMRGSLGLIASIIATITFQSALNPPGGVLQAGVSDKASLLNCSVPNSTKTLCAGQALLSLQKSDYYTAFLVYNTLCFIASLCVCLLLVSGLPLKDRFTVWLLLIAMCITVISLMAAYLMGVFLVTPDAIIGGNTVDGWFSILLFVFIALFLIVFLVQALRFVVWCGKQIKKCITLCNNNRS